MPFGFRRKDGGMPVHGPLDATVTLAETGWRMRAAILTDTSIRLGAHFEWVED